MERSDDKKRDLSLDGDLNNIKPYVRNIITDLQNSDTWKIQLKIVINLISSKDSEEERIMHSRSDNIQLQWPNCDLIVIQIILLKNSLCSKCQDKLETSIKWSDFIFNLVQVNFKRGGPYIDSPEWLKKSNNKFKKWRW